MKVKPSRLIAAGAVAALSAAIAVPALSGAQSPAATTITVQEKVRAVANDDIAPKSKKGRVSVGDRLVTRQSLFDASNQRLGTLYTDCTGVGPTKPFPASTLLCTVSYTFSNGQIVAAGKVTFGGSFELAIVGGTGAYARARGAVKSVQPAKGFDSADTITITG